jgi:predicted ATPase
MLGLLVHADGPRQLPAGCVEPDEDGGTGSFGFGHDASLRHGRLARYEAATEGLCRRDRRRIIVCVPALLERDAQRAELEELLRDLGRGRGSLLLVEGPAGIGKTEVLRLAHSMAASDRVKALQGKGGELEREFPFGVARQLFEPAVVRATPAQREQLFTGAAGRARPVLDPDRPTEARTQSAPGSVETVLHGLYWLAANLAEIAPLLLVVDDAHWADRSSLMFLAYLARRLEDLPVALVLAVRTGEAAPGAELRQIASQSRVLTIPPLSQDAVGKLAASRLGRAVNPGFAAACEEVTGGNPYLVGELLRALADAAVEPTDEAAVRVRTLAPPTVARAVLARLAGLSESAEGLARAVALLGRDAALRHAAQLADLEDAEAARAADALAAASILKHRYTAPAGQKAGREPFCDEALHDANPP